MAYYIHLEKVSQHACNCEIPGEWVSVYQLTLSFYSSWDTFFLIKGSIYAVENFFFNKRKLQSEENTVSEDGLEYKVF